MNGQDKPAASLEEEQRLEQIRPSVPGCNGNKLI